jgi:radical SAM family uncharacterized protein/radical SAM-linked protein
MLDKILPLVKKPIRYTGGEYNITVKKNPSILVGIVFPEVYEIGMSNLGIKIIHHAFNQIEGIQCERVFAPWPDFGEKLQHHDITLYGLETKQPMNEFDLLGFSLQSELSYTTILYLLDLAQIPFRAQSRDKRHPLLIAGGPAVLNPTPLSPLFDAFVIGDGEEVVAHIGRILKEIPREKKDERLKEIARLSGVWVPALHDKGAAITRNIISQLDERTCALPRILPICEITHDRFALEVMRGCTWGCRFCQAGYVNRPLRIRPEQDILKTVEKGVRQTGWEEISLLSFSILDYPNLLNLIRKLNEILQKKMVNISLPAMRGELFTEDLAMLLKEIKKTGLTFAPETASEELRRKLNKYFSNERLIESIHAAHRMGWKQVKLYFMIGLPFERSSDIDEISVLTDQMLKAHPKGGLKLSINPFIPKPHTAFESIPFAPLDELHEKIKRIKGIKRRRVEIKYQSPEVSYLEAILSRADEKIYDVIEQVYNKGGVFEEWREHFDYQRWIDAFDAVGIDPAQYLQAKDSYPWDFIDVGVNKEFLRKELERAREGTVTENCYYGACTNCGACDNQIKASPSKVEKYVSYGRYPKRKPRAIMYRVKYAIAESFRYASHRDITRTIYRTLRRSDLPVQFTQGFSPIPKVSFCPPKSVGQISKGDYFDFCLESEYLGNISMELNTRFPSGIRVLEVRAINSQVPSLSSSINMIYYDVDIPSEHLRNSVEISDEPPVFIKSRTGMKNASSCVDTISLKDSTLSCGLHFGDKSINIYELLSYLTDTSVELSKTYKVTRVAMFIKKDGILYSPMEVK